MSAKNTKNAEQCKELMLSSLTKHFQKKADQRKQLHSIISGTSPLSLRLIDWFVTHYIADNGISYWIDENNKLVEHFPERGGENLTKFNVDTEYETHLGVFTKMLFDPFRRYEHITFVLENTNPLVVIDTTVGQLNFFRWALQYKVIDYIQNHLKEIAASMAAFYKSKTKDHTKTRKVKGSAKKQISIVSTDTHYVRWD